MLPCATPEITRAIKFLVDSGAVFSVVPRKILEELGVRPLGRQKFRLANGDHISREKGIAFFRFGDRVGGADVIFGEEKDSNLLGAMTLEAAMVRANPSWLKAARSSTEPPPRATMITSTAFPAGREAGARLK